MAARCWAAGARARRLAGKQNSTSPRTPPIFGESDHDGGGSARGTIVRTAY